MKCKHNWKQNNFILAEEYWHINATCIHCEEVRITTEGKDEDGIWRKLVHRGFPTEQSRIHQANKEKEK